MNTSPEENSASTYTMGYRENFRILLSRRNAENCAAYLLPHLQPGLRVLDIGCGPGTISMGLARAVEPGELHGIDIEASQIDMAQDAAQSGGHANATFHIGDVTDLPFEDCSFDVVHCHAVLMHVPDTSAVLSEAMRVLKPGGLIASRDMFTESCFFEPGDDLAAAWTTFANLLQGNGGHPRLGKQLKGSFLDAGFVDVVATASFEHFGTEEDIGFMHGFVIGWFFSPETVGAAIGHGLASQEQFDSWRGMLDAWRTNPDAFGAFSWGEAIGRKP